MKKIYIDYIILLRKRLKVLLLKQKLLLTFLYIFILSDLGILKMWKISLKEEKYIFGWIDVSTFG